MNCDRVDNQELFPELVKTDFLLHSAAPLINNANGSGGSAEHNSAIKMSNRFQKHKDSGDFILSVDASTPVRNVQVIQPFEFNLDWRSYIIAPGAMYNGNRFIVSPQPYCPYLLTEGVSPDGPIVMADNPRLCSDTGYSVEFAANAFAIPVVGIYDSARKLGFVIGIEIYGDWGVTGVNLKTLPGTPLRLEICLPVMRKKRYRFCDWIEVNEKGMNLEPGQTVECKVRIIPIHADCIPDFISSLTEYGYSTRGTEARRSGLSFSEAADIIENKLNSFNWSEKNGYYTDRLNFPDMPKLILVQTGWVSGGVTFYALAQSGNPEIRERAVRMMDTICRNAVSPSGYFHGMHNGERWLSFGVKRPGCRSASLIRRPLECTRDVLKTIEVLERRGDTVKAVWVDAAKANLDAMVKTADKFGHLGYTVDFDTGDVLWGDSCCGAFGIEALVRGYIRFREDKYLRTAKLLAKYYVKNFIYKGYTCGGVGDSLMAVDSESNYALLAGLVYLHEVTGDKTHLKWACLTADLFATWVLHYDAKLPAGSALGKLGIQPRGAVFANIQNQHGAPGICTASGMALLKLYEITGKEHYLRLLEDIAQCIPQMIKRPEYEDTWPKLPAGSISERLMTMDGMELCGETASLSTWAEIAMLHTARELPLVYCDSERDATAVFDVSKLETKGD